jgi:hypothetical protein
MWFQKMYDQFIHSVAGKQFTIGKRENRTHIRSVFSCKFFKHFKAFMGQQLLLSNSNRDTKSPFGVRFFEILLWILTELSSKNFMSFHNKVSWTLNDVSDFATSSPNLNDPKKATKAAVQTTLFE